MDNEHFSLPTVKSTHALAVAMNVATNARTFCALLVLICLAVYLRTGTAWFATLAVQAASLVGLACIVDQLPAGVWRARISASLYIAAAATAGLLLLTIG